ncbi:ABC transporter substrate-binding protein [Polyangium sp. 15x6]|uniref:ABC transporter substrate-binding protein n=1 Tax=Polyangium sp. 15x6 TaxID=3042687 RepID=UPI00249A3D59|nr:ABC transporter substrate-binding protein [Polyangium sp. 15x6]MDI3284824.1 ABC transporter substrate-binding protein [Polyangium sp. 15x6]
MLGRRRWVMAIVALGVSALGLAACTQKDAPQKDAAGKDPSVPAAAEPWRVGAYLSLSGAETQFGIETKEGIELAVDEVNKKGGAKGRPVKVLYEDNKSNPQETNNKVLQLITRDKVVALLGEVASSRSTIGGIVANKHKIPMITSSATAPEVTQIGPFVFRVCFTDDMQGQMGAEFVVKTMGKKRIGILYASDDVYSSGLAAQFRDAAKKLGGEIVVEKSFIKTETNFTTYINEIHDAKPDLVYAPIYYNAMVPIARQAKAAGMPGSMFVGGDGWDAETLLQDAGEEMEGAYFTNHYAPDVPWPNAQAFLKAYKERFKRDPSSLSSLGYDSALLLFDAMGRAKGDTPEAIRDAIAETKNFQGATGAITIDPNRNADKSIVIVQIKNKKFTYFATVNDKAAAKP